MMIPSFLSFFLSFFLCGRFPLLDFGRACRGAVDGRSTLGFASTLLANERNKGTTTAARGPPHSTRSRETRRVSQGNARAVPLTRR